MGEVTDSFELAGRTYRRDTLGLVERRHAERVDPLRHEPLGDGDGAVTVSVGLDHRQDIHARPDEPAHFTEVVGKRGEIDVGDGLEGRQGAQIPSDGEVVKKPIRRYPWP